MNPFTRRVENVYGAGAADDERLVTYLVSTLLQLRSILRAAQDRGFGVALQIML